MDQQKNPNAMKVIRIVRFNDLPEKVQTKVIVTFRGWLRDVYNIVVFNKDIAQMFTELNTAVEFYINDEGKKLFRVDDEDERLAKFLGHQFALASRYDKKIMDKVLINMIKRNDGDKRLKIV